MSEGPHSIETMHLNNFEGMNNNTSPVKDAITLKVVGISVPLIKKIQETTDVYSSIEHHYQAYPQPFQYQMEAIMLQFFHGISQRQLVEFWQFHKLGAKKKKWETRKSLAGFLSVDETEASEKVHKEEIFQESRSKKQEKNKGENL